MNEDRSPRRQPSPVDVHVGGRIRIRRQVLGITQRAVADELGLTFQQVQKYELGTNRVSASKLFEIARFLDVPVTYFFDGLGPLESTGRFDDADTQERSIHDYLLTNEGAELAETFPRITRLRVRRQLLELIKVVADAEQSPDGG